METNAKIWISEDLLWASSFAFADLSGEMVSSGRWARHFIFKSVVSCKLLLSHENRKTLFKKLYLISKAWIDDFKQILQSLKIPGVGFIFSSGAKILSTEFEKLSKSMVLSVRLPIHSELYICLAIHLHLSNLFVMCLLLYFVFSALMVTYFCRKMVRTLVL